VISTLMIKRLGSPVDIACAAVCPCSGEALCVTAAVFQIDSGAAA